MTDYNEFSDSALAFIVHSFYIIKFSLASEFACFINVVICADKVFSVAFYKILIPFLGIYPGKLFDELRIENRLIVGINYDTVSV